MLKRFDRGQTPFWVVNKQLVDQINRIWGCARSEHFLPGVGLDLRKLKFTVVGIHRMNHFPSRCSKHLNDLHKLVNT